MDRVAGDSHQLLLSSAQIHSLGTTGDAGDYLGRCLRHNRLGERDTRRVGCRLGSRRAADPSPSRDTHPGCHATQAKVARGISNAGDCNRDWAVSLVGNLVPQRHNEHPTVRVVYVLFGIARLTVEDASSLQTSRYLSCRQDGAGGGEAQSPQQSLPSLSVWRLLSPYSGARIVMPDCKCPKT